jgi:transposase
MRRFVEEADREQWTLLPECLDDFIDESNPVRVIDVFVEALDLAEMSFEGVEPAATGRPSHHPSVLRSRLLQQPGDPRVPRGRHHGNSAQAADVGC